MFTSYKVKDLKETLPVQLVVLVWKVVELLALDKQKSQLLLAKQKALH